MRARMLVVALTTALLAAACGDGDGDNDDAAPGEDPDDGAAATDDTATSTTEAAADADDGATDYLADAAAIEVASSDRALPPTAPESPTGAYGYSRYVYIQSGGEIVPTLLEGPLGRQVRCQELAQDCSYQELKALYESGVEVPEYLGMDRDTLGELVGQLDRVNAAVMQYESIDDACAAGFSKSTNQNANMGIHMIDEFLGTGFDPDRPNMVLFAKDGGGALTGAELGNCVNGSWTGEDGFEPVGAVFNLNLTQDHPEGFAGPIDNWHVHYNTCIGRTSVSVDGGDGNVSAAEGRTSTTAEACVSAGGQFLDVIPSWMMHAYVADDFDAQSGVFSMFNPTIWPLSDNDQLVETRTSQTDDALDAPISNFAFGTIEAAAGEAIRFNNSDAVPHTVTAGTALDPLGDFDSGVLATGQSYDLTFDKAGDYQLFCVLHPDMQGTVVVS